MPIAKTNKRKTNKRKTNKMKRWLGGNDSLKLSDVLNDSQKETFEAIIQLILNKNTVDTVIKGVFNFFTQKSYKKTRHMQKKVERLGIIFNNYIDKYLPSSSPDEKEKLKKKFLEKFLGTTDNNLIKAYLFLLDKHPDESIKYAYKNKTMVKQNRYNNIGPINVTPIKFQHKKSSNPYNTNEGNNDNDNNNDNNNDSNYDDNDDDNTNESNKDNDDNNNDDNNDNNNNNNNNNNNVGNMGGKTVKNRKLKQTRKKSKN